MQTPELNAREGTGVAHAARVQSHPVVRELARSAVRTALRTDVRVGPAELEMRQAIRQTCDAARAHDVPVERLLVVLKQAWHELPDSRLSRHTMGRGTLDRVVTVCIEEYFAARSGTSSSTDR